MSDPVQLVIFDVGGTTVKLAVDVGEVLQDVFSSYGMSISRDMISEYRGASKREVITRIMRARRIDGVGASTIYDDFQRRLLLGFRKREVSPFPNVEKAFDVLRSAGIRVVLTTGFDAAVTTHLLDRLKWATRIDGIVTGDDVSSGRPAPDMILLGMARAGVTDKDQVVVVGDTVNDIEAGRRAGVGATIGVLTGAHDRKRLEAAGPTTIVESAAQVPAWLELSGM